VWWLWKWRNVRCFEDADFKPVNPPLFIHLKAKEIADAFTIENCFLASAFGSRTQENLI